MTKPTIELEIMVHGLDTAIEITDSDIAGGVLAAAQAGKNLYFPTDGGATFIPFHAISIIAVNRSTETVEDPVDELCTTPADDSQGGGGGY